MQARPIFLIISACLLTLISSSFDSSTLTPHVENSAPPGVTDYPWTMFRHDSIRSGTTLASGPIASTLAWSYLTGAQVWGSPAVSDGLVLVGSSDGTLYAFDEFTGQVKWSFPTGIEIIASPVISGGRVYVATRTPGVLYALNELTGSQVWTYSNSGYSITSSPVVADGRVFFGDWCSGGLCNPIGYFHAVNATTGIDTWTVQTSASGQVISSPSVSNAHVFFGEDDGTIVSLNESTGVAVWSIVITGSPLVRTSPAVSNGMVYVGTSPTVSNGMVYVGTGSNFVALDQFTGSTRWSFNTGNSNATSPAVNGGIVYFGTGKGRVYAVNGTTGATIWTSAAKLGVAFSSSPALSLGSGTLYLGANDHNLYAINSSNGNTVWTYATGAPIYSSPAVADGQVYFGSFDKTVYSIGKRLPQLQVSITTNSTSIESGKVAFLTVSVTNGTNPVVGSNIVLTSSIGGSFTPPSTTNPGTYTSNFTSPPVGSQMTAIITATASKSGFVSGSARVSVTVTPPPGLTVKISAVHSSVSPGAPVLLVIQVSNDTSSISGANLNFTSSAGGSFSSSTDEKNGTYLATFDAPLSYAQPTITVTAQKTGFTKGTGQIALTVSGLPDLISSKVAGFPLVIIFLVVGALVLMVLLMAVASRQKSKVYPSLPPSW